MGKRVYNGFHARIFKRKELFNNDVKRPNEVPISIMFLGLDSVSREKWLSNLPRSSNYFLNTMNASVLNGYNIVGDGTPAALIPILTSKHEHELPNTLKGRSDASHVDEVYPFVWKDFQENLNYATLYNEDWSVIIFKRCHFKSIDYLTRFFLFKANCWRFPV